MLDTHILAWFAGNRNHLSATERTAIDEFADKLLVSAISVWELRLRWRSNPRRAAQDALLEPEAALRFCARHEIEVLAFPAAAAAARLEPPFEHKDPFDEVLLVHAQHAGARVLTRDGRMLEHPLAYHP